MRRRFATWPPILRALAALLVAVGLVLLLARTGVLPLPPWGWALVVGVFAAFFGRVLQLEIWWLPVLAAFPLAIGALAARPLAPGWYLGCFGLLWLIYWSSHSTRVPLYLSGPKVRNALLARLPPAPVPLRFVDLGCGLGGLALALARTRPDGQFRGVELAPLPAAIALLRARYARLPNLRLARASLWDEPLGDYDVVYCFLSPVPMPRLWEKARREMRAGALLVSNSFGIPGVAPDEVIDVQDARGSQLFVWRMKGSATA